MSLFGLFLVCFAAIGGGIAIGLFRSDRAKTRWQPTLEEARSLLPEASITETSQGPELRVRIDGRTINLRIDGSPEAADQGQAYVFTSVRAKPRIYLGWDRMPPADWPHVPDAAVPSTRMEGTLYARSDDPGLASQLAEAVYLDLEDIARESGYRGGRSIAVRSGYLELVWEGIGTSGYFLERLTRSAGRIAGNVEALCDAGEQAGVSE